MYKINTLFIKLDFFFIHSAKYGLKQLLLFQSSDKIINFNACKNTTQLLRFDSLVVK